MPAPGAQADVPAHHAVLVGQETCDAVEVISRVDSEIDFEVDLKVEASTLRIPGPIVNGSGLLIGTGSFSNQPLQLSHSINALPVADALGSGDALQNRFEAMRLFQDAKDSSILLHRPMAHSTPGPGAAALLLASLFVGTRRRNSTHSVGTG